MFDLTVSIVAYKNSVDVIKNAVDSVLNTNLNIHLYISDNSPTDTLRVLKVSDKITYIFNNQNLGFGRAHNIIVNKVKYISKYHLILNPDVHFDKDVLIELYNIMEKKHDIGIISPKVIYPNGETQLSCRLIPSSIDLIIRRVTLLEKVFLKRIKFHELIFTNYDKTMEVPFILGCFLFIRTDLLNEIGGFDERFFMYMEDLDLCRRIGRKGRILFIPNIIIKHIYERGSRKKLKLLLFHISSMIKYFNKWGWIFDKERKEINKKALEKLNVD
jgi:GT2 family glycosyltransferase